jgi:hypothetical protein
MDLPEHLVQNNYKINMAVKLKLRYFISVVIFIESRVELKRVGSNFRGLKI